jgi:hypothetical protein
MFMFGHGHLLRFFPEVEGGKMAVIESFSHNPDEGLPFRQRTTENIFIVCGGPVLSVAIESSTDLLHPCAGQ